MNAASVESSQSSMRILAAVAHAGVLLPGWGLLAPAIVWSTHLRRGGELSFQALQALTYQLLLSLVVLAIAFAGGVGLILWSFGWLLISNLFSLSLPEVLLWIGQAAYLGLMLAVWGMLTICGIVVAVLCLLGQNPRYPLVGRFLQRHLAADPEEGEGRWMAALGHLGAVAGLPGLLVPLVLWISGQRDSRLRFQALQAWVYQALGNLVLVGLGLLAAISALLNLLWKTVLDRAPSGWLFFLFCPGPLLPVTAVLEAVYPVLAIWAAWHVAQGRDFYYPLLGRWLQRRFGGYA